MKEKEQEVEEQEQRDAEEKRRRWGAREHREGGAGERERYKREEDEVEEEEEEALLSRRDCRGGPDQAPICITGIYRQRADPARVEAEESSVSSVRYIARPRAMAGSRDLSRDRREVGKR